MPFGLDKGAEGTFIKGKMMETFNITLVITEEDPAENYKYLGVLEGE